MLPQVKVYTQDLSELTVSNESCTQGNDQVRFEMTYYALYPGVKVGAKVQL